MIFLKFAFMLLELALARASRIDKGVVTQRNLPSAVPDSRGCTVLYADH